jgi:hypothetical protein
MTGKRPVFLNPGTYRRRRLRDAARLLPVMGGFLFLLPILWAPGLTDRRDTAPDGIYLFAIWGGLIVIAAILSRRLSDGDDTPPPVREEED